MNLDANDGYAHSLLRWTWDDPVDGRDFALIRELVRMLVANVRNNKFSLSHLFVPVGQVDVLADEVATLLDAGFSKQLTDRQALRHGQHKEKAALIFDLVRGTMERNGLVHVAP